MKTPAIRILNLLVPLLLAASAMAEDGPAHPGVVLSFAGVEEGRKILSTRDEFIQSLSPFDRAARMKVGHPVSEKEFLDFIGRSVEPWQPDETNQVARVIDQAKAGWARWKMPFPPVIVFIKTSGLEEGGACYTRQNAVVLPERELQSPRLQHTITHELFHILSRNNPELRKKMYAVIGFQPAGSIAFPTSLQPQKLTNPDGTDGRWFICVTNQGQMLRVTPILFASQKSYDPAQGGDFFRYLEFKLMAITNDGTNWSPSLDNTGQPRLFDPSELGGFWEQIGKNTQYIIHPDEILADNFVFLANGRTNLPTPRIVEEMGKVLATY